MTRKTIIEIIMDVGLNTNDFIIGSGARYSHTEIHYRPYDYKASRDGRKTHSIQFCDNVVAIWEIGKRIDKCASIDIKWEGLCWKDIQEVRERKVGIKGFNEYTSIAVMPLYCLEPYLRYTFGKNDAEKYYLDRREGARVEIYTTRYERNPQLRKQAINIHGTLCMVCGFSFEQKYGTIGEGFVEVHHIKPISQGPREVDPEKDMVCLCANCHRMIHHKRNRVLTVDELKKMIKGNKV